MGNKSNIHKKETEEDKFDRAFAAWVKNNRKAWMFWKLFRRKGKEEIRDYGDYSQ